MENIKIEKKKSLQIKYLVLFLQCNQKWKEINELDCEVIDVREKLNMICENRIKMIINKIHNGNYFGGQKNIIEHKISRLEETTLNCLPYVLLIINLSELSKIEMQQWFTLHVISELSIDFNVETESLEDHVYRFLVNRYMKHEHTHDCINNGICKYGYTEDTHTIGHNKQLIMDWEGYCSVEIVSSFSRVDAIVQHFNKIM